MTQRMARAGACALVIATLAVVFGTSLLGPTVAQAGGDKDKPAKLEKGKPGEGVGGLVQTVGLRWRDGWPYGIADQGAADDASEHVEGEFANGEATLTRRADGVHLELRDYDVVKNNAYSIWFQICPIGTGFKDSDTQCVQSKLLNMNGGGDVAGPKGLVVNFDLAVGTIVGPRNVCEIDDAMWWTEPCPAWGIPGILVGSVEFTADMALLAPVRIVVKNHGPVKNVKDVGKERGLKTQDAIFAATHRTDSADCQPARPVCPDAHVAVFAGP